MKIIYIAFAFLFAGELPNVAIGQELPTEEQSPTSAEITPYPALLQQVAMMIDSGHFEEARTLLTLFRMQPIPHMEVLFLSGRIYAGIGDYPSASDEFRKMLVRDATLVRPRLELAHALFMSREYEGASYHFQQVLAGSMPEDVRAKVQGFLTAIREKLPSYSLTFDVINDSNPAQSTNNKTVSIGGRSYLLSTTAPNKSIWGVALGGSANIPFGDDSTWFARANANLTDYPNQISDQVYVQVTAGKRFSYDANTLTLEMGGQLFNYRDRQLYSGSVWRIGDFWRQSNQSNWQVTLQGAEQAYPDYSYQNGWQYTFTVENQFAQTATSRWQTGASYSQNQARESPYTFSSPSAYVRYVHEWQGGVISGIRLQQSQSDYWGNDPFFGIKRRDGELRIEIDLLNRNWNMFGLSPRLLLGRIDHASNVSLYQFRRNYVRVGASREF